jgi:hypothetical protein
VWNRTARDAAFVVDGRDVTLQSATFDLPHRVRGIAKLPFQDAERGAAAVRDALVDDALAPYLRLWFIRRIDFFAHGWEDLLPDARRVVGEMRADATDDKLALFLDDAGAYLARVAEALKTPRAERERWALRSLK